MESLPFPIDRCTVHEIHPHTQHACILVEWSVFFLGAESSEIDSLLDRFSLDGLSSHNVGGTESDSGLVV